MNQQLKSILEKVPAASMMGLSIHIGLETNREDEVLSMLHRQSIDAPSEVIKLIGETGFQLIQKVA